MRGRKVRAPAVTPLVLASRSPQRRAILAQLGVPFEVVEPGAEELGTGEPRAVVIENALRKARSLGQRARSRRVLGVDTAVVVDGRIHGKPREEADARRVLERLAGREHVVWSGIALLDPSGGERTAAEATRVRFRALDTADLDWYLASGEWRGRAGGYAIQGRGATLVERIEGDYSNVVGLPVAALARLAPDLFRA